MPTLIVEQHPVELRVDDRASEPGSEHAALRLHSNQLLFADPQVLFPQQRGPPPKYGASYCSAQGPDYSARSPLASRFILTGA
jgi:hypothetical protein